MSAAARAERRRERQDVEAAERSVISIFDRRLPGVRTVIRVGKLVLLIGITVV